MINRFGNYDPQYQDDADYTTNSPSYYADLARKQGLIELLSKRIWEYDEELGKRFAAWDKNLEEFDDEVKLLLQTWIDDGTFATIINEEIFKQKADTKNTLVGLNILSMKHFEKNALDTSDSQRLQRAIDEAADGTTLFLADKKLYEIDEPVIILNKTVHLTGFNVELKTVKDGLHQTFSITNAPNIKITGIKFNQNIKGRISIDLKTSPNYVVSYCEFTGYSLDFGYYKTDSALLISTSNNGKILYNYIHDSGFQYGTQLSDLNRAITVQVCDNTLIHGNTIARVNQAIVIQGGSHIISENNMSDVKDNSLYLLDQANTHVTNNIFNDKFDECIVLDGKNFIIDGNTFIDSPNKFIAINDNIVFLKIINNTFRIVTAPSGKFISYRLPTYTIENLIVRDNSFTSFNDPLDENAEFFEIGNVKKLDFSNNYLNLKTQGYQRFMYFKGNQIGGRISDNVFLGNSGNSKTIELSADVLTGSIVYEGNTHENCRGMWNDKIIIKNQGYRGDIGPYITSMPNNQVFYSSVKPTSGVFSIGDICYNTDVQLNKFVGWVYTSTGWDLFGQVGYSVAQTRASIPVNWVSPKFVGEIFINSLDSSVWVGLKVGDSTTTGWKKITV